MADVGMQDLLRAGVHFGHQTSRWNPKMRKYIFAERSGIYLLDLKKTLRQLERARDLIRETVEKGESVLFVCTKPQLSEIVRREAKRCGAFHVTERWVGGLLTNFQTIKKNIRRLKELETGLEEGHFDYYTKKEQILLDREREKLERYLAGIKQMTELPGLVFVVDAKREEIAVKEADRLEIPVVAIADTNADPERLDVPIPGNDDAIRAVELITSAVADAVEAAKREIPEAGVEDEAEAYTYSSDVDETAEEAAERSKRRKKPRRRPKPEVIARARQAAERMDGDVDPEKVAVETAVETGEPAVTAAPDEGGEAADEEPDAAGPDAEADAGDGADREDDEDEEAGPSAEAGADEAAGDDADEAADGRPRAEAEDDDADEAEDDAGEEAVAVSAGGQGETGSKEEPDGS